MLLSPHLHCQLPLKHKGKWRGSTFLLESPGDKYYTPEALRTRSRLRRGSSSCPRPFILPDADDDQDHQEEDLMPKAKRRCLEPIGEKSSFAAVTSDKENLDPQDSSWLSIPLLPVKEEPGTASLSPEKRFTPSFTQGKAFSSGLTSPTRSSSRGARVKRRAQMSWA